MEKASFSVAFAIAVLVGMGGCGGGDDPGSGLPVRAPMVD
jgi:hypothetical protein